MSDVIDLLEKMGQDAQWRGASPAAVEMALSEAGLVAEQRAAIVAEDQDKLRALLGIIPLCGLINPAKEEDDEDESEEIPSRKDEEIPQPLTSLQSAVG